MCRAASQRSALPQGRFQFPERPEIFPGDNPADPQEVAFVGGLIQTVAGPQGRDLGF